MLAALGVGLWALGFRAIVFTRLPVRASLEPTPIRAGALALAAVLAAATWVSSSDGVSTPWTVIAWTAAVATWCAAVAATRAWRWEWRLWVPEKRRLWTAIAVAGALSLGVFVRLSGLDEMPLEPTSDSAEKLLDLADVHAGEHTIFFPRNTGREPLQFYVSAAMAEAGLGPTFFMSIEP